MKMDNDSVRELTHSLTEMAKNVLIDEAFPAFFAVTVHCKTCDNFHMYTYDSKKMTSGLTASTVIGSLLFNTSMSDMVLQSFKGIGAQLSANEKQVLAATMVACGGSIDVDKVKHAGLSEDEVRELVLKAIDAGDLEGVKVSPNLFVATHAQPDIYYQITYQVELIGNNDMLLTNKELHEEREEGNMYVLHEALLESASFLDGIQIAVCGEQQGADTPLAPQNEAKFRSFLDKAEMSLKVADIV